MPQGDRTGPSGQGQMTGRGMGFCAGLNAPGFMSGGFRRGMGRGRDFGWRGRVMPIQPVQPTVITEKQEKQFLEQDLEALKEEMEEVEKRLKEFKE